MASPTRWPVAIALLLATPALILVAGGLTPVRQQPAALAQTPSPAPIGPLVTQANLHRVLAQFPDCRSQGGGVTPATLPAVSAEGAGMPPPIIQFDGGSRTSGPASDVSGSPGLSHYMQTVNTTFSIFDKATGALLCGPVPHTTFWRGIEACHDGFSDAVLLFDHLPWTAPDGTTQPANRFVISAIAGTMEIGGRQIATHCMAVSQTSDPTGAWDLYRLPLPIGCETVQPVGCASGDYSKLGIGPEGYFISGSPGGVARPGLTGAWAIAFQRIPMLAGEDAPGSVQFVLPKAPNSEQRFMFLPADVDGPNLPPAGEPHYFAQLQGQDSGFPTAQLVIWQMAIDWSRPAQATYTAGATLPVQPFSSAFATIPGCLATTCIPQLGTPERLQTLSESGILMNRLVYRNLGSSEVLLANHTIQAPASSPSNLPARAGIRWYELRKPASAVSSWAIHQQGTYAPDVNWRWLGSIAMDAAGNIALGSSLSSAGVYPSIVYAGRVASDPLNELPRAEQTLIAGRGSRTDGGHTFGDYSQMTIDPVDDCAFWFTSAYYPSQAAGAANMEHTRIGAFRFPNCPPQPAPLPGAPQSMRVSGLVQRILPPLPSENIVTQEVIPAAGARVEALVGDTVCGSAVSDADGRFQLAIAADPPARGCGRPGLTVTFRVNGMVVGESLSFRAGGTAEVDLRLPATLVPELLPRP